MIQATNGNIYGTTDAGGVNGTGTLFKFQGRGTYKVLYNFAALPGYVNMGGAEPTGVIQASDGSLFGACYSGGSSGTGTVYKFKPQGSFNTLYNFGIDGNPQSNTTGARPTGLIQAPDGVFYGTTYQGGLNDIGVIYKINYGGQLTVLHTFGNPEGSPSSVPALASDGNL